MEMNVKLTRTNSEDKDFLKLVDKLESYLDSLDSESHNACKEFNRLETVNHVVTAHMNDVVIGCGAIREYNINTVEIKRMFVRDEQRGSGVASHILTELETWAKEQGFEFGLLETGTMMIDAIKFYEKHGYIHIENYDQYDSMSKSICFSKKF